MKKKEYIYPELDIYKLTFANVLAEESTTVPEDIDSPEETLKPTIAIEE